MKHIKWFNENGQSNTFHNKLTKKKYSLIANKCPIHAYSVYVRCHFPPY